MNRAHRLAAWLEVFSKNNAKAQSKLGPLMAKELGVEFKSPAYYTALTSLSAQYAELRDTFLEALSGERQKAIFSRAFQSLDPFFDPIYVSQVNASELAARQDDVDHLFVVSEQMVQDELVTEQAVIDNVITQAQDLQAALLKLSIDKVMQLNLARLIDTFIMALRGHEIVGMEGLSAVFGSLASEIARAAAPMAKHDAASKTWTQKATGFLKTVAVKSRNPAAYT